MRVLITGGAGYIGSHCNRLFADKGIETVVLDDLSDGHKAAVVAGEFVKGNYGDRVFMKQLFSQYTFDGIIHFAAFASVPDSVARPQRYYDNNVAKMLALLDEAVASGIKYFVFSSSAATFGEPQYVPIDEKHPQHPINPYGMTKLIGEEILADYEKAYGIHSCSFRYFNAAGDAPDGMIGEAHNPESHLIPLVMRAAMTGEKMKVFGDDYATKDGSCVRDYVHVEDLAEAHYLGLQYIMEHNISENFNLGSSDGFSVLDLIRTFEKILGQKIPYDIVGRRAGDPAVLVASNAKAKELLGWDPKRSDLETILNDAWHWEQHRKY
ncbi:UDP-glucose 4-epimerase GalE [Megasphaera paucivorans]|uniref:UDP-glucose 4-epimerase n=1 Tax=Megasphaera paucivorans TaxID=349095 RepID=A0A1G9W2U0_9FIRM|nr:UDP-glucose 4-epimerase GalE [Megasphaera paucivorans]SDM78527.1 UDP-glucose 4-epimerase [Megasphaera paucivorans]